MLQWTRVRILAREENVNNRERVRVGAFAGFYVTKSMNEKIFMKILSLLPLTVTETVVGQIQKKKLIRSVLQ